MLKFIKKPGGVMIKSMFISMALTMSLISTASAGDLTKAIHAAVSKARGKCVITETENEQIKFLCVRAKVFSAMAISLQDNIISGTGQVWTEQGDESECSIIGNVNTNDKVKLSIRCKNILSQ